MKSHDSPYLNKIDFTQPPRLDYLFEITDSLGIVQHTKYKEPAYEHGYSIDDQSRALTTLIMYENIFRHSLDPQLTKKITQTKKIYLDFIQKAQLENGFFNNYMSSDGQFLVHGRSEENFGRSLWAIGYFISQDTHEELVDKYSYILDNMNKYIDQLRYKRGLSYSLIGYSYLAQNNDSSSLYKTNLIKLREKILSGFINESDWCWFEDSLTYANGIIVYALLRAHHIDPREEILDKTLAALEFVHISSSYKGYPSPIGHNGWFKRGSRRSVYGQQAIDSADMVLAFSEAYRITSKREYLDKAIWWFGWFQGNNSKGIEMVDRSNWSVFDGINKHGRNQNRGAESIVCYLLAYLSLSQVYLNR